MGADELTSVTCEHKHLGNIKYKRNMVGMSGITTGPRGHDKKEYTLCTTVNHIIPEGGEEGRLDDDTHADTCLLGKGFMVTKTYEYGCQVSGFTSSLGSMRLNIVDAETVVTDADGEEAIIVINQGIHKPDEDRSLFSMFQAMWSGTRVENDLVQHNPDSRFGLIFPNVDGEDTVIRFDFLEFQLAYRSEHQQKRIRRH